MSDGNPLLDDSVNPEEGVQLAVSDSEIHPSFDAAWTPKDTAVFNPSNLPFSKPTRAWERKATSPFVGQRSKVRKIWKRARVDVGHGATFLTSGVLPLAGSSTLTTQPHSAKAVKKLCISPHSAIGTQWERVASPVKRIITRSAQTSELVALPDENDDAGVEQDEEEDGEGTIVEILDESGQVVDVDPAEAVKEEGWSDAEDDADVFDNTMMHLDAVVQHQPKVVSRMPSPVRQPNVRRLSPEKPLEKPSHLLFHGESQDADTTHGTSLPLGFVSPVKRHRTVSKRLREAQRRRTLPRTFAPVDLGVHDQSTEPAQETTEDAMSSHDEHHPGAIKSDTAATASATVPRRQEEANDEWEDVEHNHTNIPGNPSEESRTAPLAEDETYSPQILHYDTSSSATIEDNITGEHMEAREDLVSESVTAIVGLTNPSRRLSPSKEYSLRRKSSSPVKARSYTGIIDHPHVIAYSPLKPGNSVVAFSFESPAISKQQDNTPEEVECIPQTPLQSKRSMSEPPEEIQMSPRRHEKPRVSDDTALLQAFLNRAAESKESRRASVSRRESLTNRRESDTVRLALASPAKATVLLEMDPNSPSPRKVPTLSEDGPVLDANVQFARLTADEVGDEDEDLTLSKNRRGGRERRRTERIIPTAPNKISLLGNRDPRVVRRTEAQELASLTRNNTRKNKGDAILPPFRLPALANPEDLPEAVVEVVAEPKSGRTVTWNETLIYFTIDPREPDVADAIDPELESKEVGVASHADDAVKISLPTPTDAPLKPKVRRLKAPKAATIAAEPPVESSVSAPTPTAPPQDSQVPRARVRRTRAATPAKGLGKESLLPDDLTISTIDSWYKEQETSSITAAKAPEPRRKPATRLPTPSVELTSSFSLPSSQDKQQAYSITASPPKRRTSIFAAKPDVKKEKADAPIQLELPGFASPAKKLRRAVVLGANISQPSGMERSGVGREVPGLGSPAKKRTRRLA